MQIVASRDSGAIDSKNGWGKEKDRNISPTRPWVRKFDSRKKIVRKKEKADKKIH